MSANALPRPCLMLVTDRNLAGGEDRLVEAVAAAVEGGVNAVQLREKDLAPTDLARLARRLREAIGGRALLIVNGSADVARDVGADGVHLPTGAPFVRPDGVALAGPVYETASHPGRPAAGVELVSRAVADVRIPVVAIGGITAARVPDVLSAGAAGVAVISAVLGVESPAAGASALREALDTVVVER